MIQAILFDFDGTLTRPGSLDFPAFKRRLGCPPDEPVWEYIQGLKGTGKQAALQQLDNFELAAADQSKPNIHAEDIVDKLKSQGYRLGILTRNSQQAVERAITHFSRLSLADFDVVITRDTPVAMKPDPDGILHTARLLNIPVEAIVVVGDYHFDMQAGRRAGAVTVYIKNHSPGLPEGNCDFQINTLKDLEEVLNLLVPLPQGKLPNHLLARMLPSLHRDSSVLIPPGIGRDTTAVNIAGREVLVLTSDPITFATDAVGLYTVLVNANDLACSGADPRWLLTTLLMPKATTGHDIFKLMREINSMCATHGISLCGGHTEITDAVTRPVIVGTLAGTVARDDLQDRRNARPGDRVLLTKVIAVEGTALIAREFPQRLLDAGVSRAIISRSRDFLRHISIVKEARVACAHAGTTALHDTTEGGIATALEELSTSIGFGLRIDRDAIPIFPETQRICDALGLDPLGLIASGSLLICCRPETATTLCHALAEKDIAATSIGHVLDAEPGILAFHKGKTTDWPSFHRDELARLF